MVDKKLPFPDGELTYAFELGAVDHQTVRAWIRDPGTSTATVTLSVEGRPDLSAGAELSADADWTGVVEFRLDTPAPGARFVCSYGGRQRVGRFPPQPGEHAGLIFGFGSCDRPFALNQEGEVVHNPASQIYPLMRAELAEEQAAFMLLGGDQIYSDELDPISVRTGLVQDPDNPPPMDELIDAYRRIYRGYFGHPGFKALRESISTLCIWDDHDIYDNWGSTLHQTPLDTAMFHAAAHTYQEYQHLRNPGAVKGPPPYHYHFQHGDVGFFVFDVRGQRDFVNDRILGPDQWEDLDRFLDSEEAAGIQTLFIVSTIPLAHTARWMGVLFSDRDWRIAGAVRDRWMSNRFVSQRDALLTRLFDWQTAKPRRQVIALSGDIHVAAATTIRQRNGPGVIRQFISSAMTTPIELAHVIIHRIVTKGINLFEPRFRFQHHFLARENNYGLVRVEPHPDGGHRVEMDVRGLDSKTRKLTTVGSIRCSPE